MTQIANFTSEQEVTPADMNNLAGDPRDLIDALVKQSIEAGSKFAGGVAAKSATTTVTITTPLYLFRDGAIYSRSDAGGVEVAMTSLLPTTGLKRIVAITLGASEAPTDYEEREVVVDASVSPPTVTAQSVATRISRTIAISTVNGASAAEPDRPTVDATLTVLAWVTLTSTEIESVEEAAENRVQTLGEVDDRVDDLEDWREGAEPTLLGAVSDIGALAGEIGGLTDRRMFSSLLETVAQLSARLDVGTGAAFSQTDLLIDEDQSDPADAAYLAKVEEGVRFDDEAIATQTLALDNPADTKFVVHPNGVLLPKYAVRYVVNNWRHDDEVALSNAGSQTVTFKRRTVSRSRLRFGPTRTVCSNSKWWSTGRFDPLTGVFERDGETFTAELDESRTYRHTHYRVQKIWVDTYDENHWDAQLVETSYTGNIAAQTAVMPRTGWLTHLRFGFSRVDSQGDVRVMVAHTTETGAPDPNSVIAETTIAVDDLLLSPARTEVAIGPVLLEGGTRYAVILVTAGNHYLALSTGNKTGEGSMFTSTDGAWFDGDIEKDFNMAWRMAQFSDPRVSIRLEPWALSGGVADLDLLIEAIGAGMSPDGKKKNASSITFEIKASGGAWTPLSTAGAATNPFAGLPASVEARMVLQGTRELMPGINIAESDVKITRPRTSFTHVSAERVVPVSTDEIEVIAYLEGYVEANHDCTAAILTGGAFDTETAPTATTDEVQPDGSIRRVFHFTGVPSTTSFKRKLTGSAASALEVFHAAAVTDVAYPA